MSYQNFPKYFFLLELTETKSVAIQVKSKMTDLSTYNKNTLFSQHSVIVVLKKVFILRREENDRSEEAVVTGNV